VKYKKVKNMRSEEEIKDMKNKAEELVRCMNLKPNGYLKGFIDGMTEAFDMALGEE
jgi:hypothetical protein